MNRSGTARFDLVSGNRGGVFFMRRPMQWNYAAGGLRGHSDKKIILERKDEDGYSIFT